MPLRLIVSRNLWYGVKNMDSKKLVALTVFLLILSCAPEPCYQYRIQNYTNFPVSSLTLNNGILFDDPKHELNYNDVIILNNKVLDCLINLPKLSVNELSNASCQGAFDLTIKSCLIVKVPTWHHSVCTNEELFECSVGNQPCYDKGQVPTAECPCYCRAMIQDGNVLLTTPNLKLYPAYLTTLLTGCTNPWTEHLAVCSNLRP